MAEVTLAIGGNSYTLTCRDGEEGHLRAMAAVIDAKATEARAAVGGLSEVRQLLFAALLLADELTEARRAPSAAMPIDANLVVSLAQFATRAEALASRLEKHAQ